MIRSLAPADIPACARLMAASPLWQRYGVSESAAAQRFETGLAQNATILVAEEHGQVAGFVWYVTRGAFNRSGYIMLIGVQPDRQGQGAGRALMAAAEQQMFTQVSDVFLLTSDFNQPAQRFYEHLGYTQIGSIPDYVIPGVTELIFRKHKPDAA